MLDSPSIEWTGVSEPPVVKAVMLDFETTYVALLRRGTLERLIDRAELGKRIAERAMT
jgi:hypothetical protein